MSDPLSDHQYEIVNPVRKETKEKLPFVVIEVHCVY